MSDNVEISAGSGTPVATDDIAGVQYQRVKVVWGVDGTANDTNATTPLPVDLTNTGANTTALNVAQSGAWNITNVSGTVSLPTGAATAAKQPALGTAGTASADVITVQGIASMTALKVDGSDVTQPVSDGGSSLTIDNAALSVTGGGAEATALRVTLASDGTGVLSVDDNGSSLTVDGTVAATQSGTWDVGTVTTVTTVSTLTGGGVAHDSADSGNPVKVGARAAATLSDDTMVANSDRTDAVSDLDGALLVRQQFPLGDLISERVTDTGGSSTAFTNFGATASTRSYITAIAVYNSSATAGTIDFRDGTAGSVLWTMPIPATGGSIIATGVPLFRTSSNTALAYDVSGALTTVTISVSGFKSKV